MGAFALVLISFKLSVCNIKIPRFKAEERHVLIMPVSVLVLSSYGYIFKLTSLSFDIVC